MRRYAVSIALVTVLMVAMFIGGTTVAQSIPKFESPILVTVPDRLQGR